MDNFIKNIQESQDTQKEFTPQSLAWDLLFGEIDENKKGKIVLLTSNNDNLDLLESCLYTHETLMIIFMELLFGIDKVNFYINNQDKTYFPNYKSFDINTIFDTINEKFNMFDFNCIVDIYDINKINDKIENIKQKIQDLIDNRYCRVLLKYYNDESFDDVDEDVFYQFKINGKNNISYKSIEQIYSIIELNNVFYKISFSKR